MKATFEFKKTFTQKIALFLGVSLLVALSFFAGRSLKPSTRVSPSPIQEKETTESPKQPSPTPSIESEEKLSNKGQISKKGIVSYVIDGDTIVLKDGEKVRYLGMNTPEKGRPFSAEATEQNKKLIDGKEVELELDVQTKDQYGRTLAYVWLGETMVNLKLVRLGYANVYTLPPNVKYKDQLLSAEREAREAERGFWAKSLETKAVIPPF